MFRPRCSPAFLAILIMAIPTSLLGQSTQPFRYLLKVSDNRRFLVREDGTPFFYMADTAWELFHRLTREEADLYLETRARQGFTVIQAVVLAELDGLKTPNAYGQLPLIDNDPTRPNLEYFKHVDYIVNKAESLGLFIGMLPTWGDKVNRKWGGGPEIFTPGNAREYGHFLGKRYRKKPIIWILGGDRPVETDRQRDIWRSMAAGLTEGEIDNRHLMTYHINGGLSTHEVLHDESWIDFNMCQSGHARRSTPNYRMIAAAYAKTPTKPCMDSECNYEDHPINWGPKNGWFDEHDVRKLTYWGLFAGAHGVTYGCQDVWQFWTPPRQPIAFARTPWKQALNLPAANQMKYVRALVESRPYFTRIPDQGLLADDLGDSLDHLQACRSSDGAYAFIYTPTSKPFTVNLNRLTAARLKAWWYSPRTGDASEIGVLTNTEPHQFTPPQEKGAGADWVLVVDDASKDFPRPGVIR